MTRVVLHVGAPKTGTTYVQNRLAANRRSLAAHGVSYPVLWPGDFDHSRPVHGLVTLDQRGSLDADRHWKALVKRIRRADRTAVVSHELLAAADPTAVVRAVDDLSGLDVHVVFSVRDLGRQIPAMWQEAVKQGSTVSFTRFVRQLKRRRDTLFWRTQDPRLVLGRWGVGVDEDHLHLVTVPPEGSARTLLWHRMCTALGVDPDWAPVDEPGRADPAMGIAETKVVRLLNKRLRAHEIPSEVHERLVLQVIAQGALARRPNARVASLGVEDLAWAREVGEEWKEWISATRIDVIGDLSDLMPASDPSSTWVDPDQPNPRAAFQAALDGLAAATLEAARLSESGPVTLTADRVARRLWRR